MRTTTLLIAALVALCGCKREREDPPPKTEAHHDDEDHAELPKQLRVEPQLLEAAGIKTEAARRSVLAATVSLPGEVAAEPDRTAQLSAVTAGKLEQVGFNEGSSVKKGDVLAILRVPDVGRLKGALAAATAKEKASRSNAERLRSLAASGLGAEQAVVDAEAEARSQEAEAKALREQLAAIGVAADSTGGYLVPLCAPISGVVVARNAVVGQPVSVDHVLATLVDLSEVWFIGRVFEKDVGRLRAGAKAHVQLNAFPGDHFDGAVEYVGQQTDPVARTLTARIRLTNADGRLRLGLFGSAHVEVEEPRKLSPQVVVPRSAVTDIGGKSVVFVKAKDGDFVVHEVTLGESALAQVQVLSGLTEGEEIATQGVFTLKSLLLKSTLGEDEH